MLKITDYAEQIDALHAEGKYALEIAKILGFRYSQPVYNYFKKKGWETLSRENYPTNATYEVDKSFFSNINTEEKAYILGFICADGHIDAISYRISIVLQDSDYQLLDRIKLAMHSTHPIKRGIIRENPYTRTSNSTLYQCSLHINGKGLVEPLVSMGIAGKKTYNLDSNVLRYIPEQLIRHFLRGYFDCDGSVTWGKHYSSGNKYLIQVAGNEEFLLNTFQKYFPSNCELYKYKTSRQCFTWKLADKKRVLEFLNFIYKDSKIYLDRKYKIYQYAMWSFKTELIAGNSYFSSLLEGQSAANPLVKCLRQVQRLADETIQNPFEEGSIEYNSATNAQYPEPQNISG
jgi:hypothetical protein